MGVCLQLWETKQNIALCMEPNRNIQLRHKQILVPFGEAMPFNELLGKLPFVKRYRDLIFEKKENASSLFHHNGDVVFTAICFESFF
jgi:apolipoprotein N-acyltransferase